MKEDAAANESVAKPKRKRLPKTLVIVLGITVLEAAVFFFIFKAGGGGPDVVHGEGSHALEGAATSRPAAADSAEVTLLKAFKVPNDKSGRVLIYDLDLSVVVPADSQQDMEKLARAHDGEIKDRVARILRAATHQMLQEDDLRALRQQLAAGLREIVTEDDLIRRILIPRLVPIRSD